MSENNELRDRFYNIALKDLSTILKTNGVPHKSDGLDFCDSTLDRLVRAPLEFRLFLSHCIQQDNDSGKKEAKMLVKKSDTALANYLVQGLFVNLPQGEIVTYGAVIDSDTKRPEPVDSNLEILGMVTQIFDNALLKARISIPQSFMLRPEAISYGNNIYREDMREAAAEAAGSSLFTFGI